MSLLLIDAVVLKYRQHGFSIQMTRSSFREAGKQRSLLGRCGRGISAGGHSCFVCFTRRGTRWIECRARALMDVAQSYATMICANG